jgi:hypothetical protein
VFSSLEYNIGVFNSRLHRFAAIFPALILILNFCTSPISTAVSPCPNTNAFSGISGLALWLRADCVNGVATLPADNSSVTTWSDLSGNNNNATASGTPTFQSDAGNLINSQPVINFNGGSSFSSIDIRATTRPNITIFAVYKERGTGNREGVWGIDNGGWDRFFLARWSANDGLISAGNSANVTNTGVVGTPTMVTTVYKYNISSGSTVYVNGASATTITDQADPNAAYTSLLIGSGGDGLNFNGDIAEIVIFSQALTNSDLITVNGYLNTKYNLGVASAYLPIAYTAPTFNSFALAGAATTATYRTAISINANVNQASKITFTTNGKAIPGCKGLTASGSGSSFASSCTWRPSNRGSVLVSAIATGTSGGLTGTPTSPLKILVSTRTNKR